jgi:serine/threonine-protein kinase RsbT
MQLQNLSLPRPPSPSVFAGMPTEPSGEETTITINTVADIVTARQQGRELARESGFLGADSTLIATIISELARNIVLYAKAGEMVLIRVHAQANRPSGLIMISRDNGPGISDVRRALIGGYSTSGGLGLGLCGVSRLVDEFEIDTGSGKGTTVIAKKWLR